MCVCDLYCAVAKQLCIILIDRFFFFLFFISQQPPTVNACSLLGRTNLQRMNKHGERDHGKSGCLQYGCSYLSMACSAVLCGGGKKDMDMDSMTSEEIRAANPSFYNAKLIDKKVDADWGWVFASGGDELRTRAKEEFINFAMVSALTLSITLPLLLSPPDLIDTDGNRTHWKYQV